MEAQPYCGHWLGLLADLLVVITRVIKATGSTTSGLTSSRMSSSQQVFMYFAFLLRLGFEEKDVTARLCRGVGWIRMWLEFFKTDR